jgi:hypothetical protein
LPAGRPPCIRACICAQVSFDTPQPSYDLAKFVPLECPAGTLVLLHGENVHYSAENTSPISRHSYSMHVVESAPGVAWSPDNWCVWPQLLLASSVPWPLRPGACPARCSACCSRVMSHAARHAPVLLACREHLEQRHIQGGHPAS